MTLVNGDTNATLASASFVGAVPNLSLGHLLVGNSQNDALTAQTPWHGYVSQVLVCINNGDLANCR
jgi:UDP-N-acetylglucosamine 2-epimerase